MRAMTIAKFLLARIAEDEAVALAARAVLDGDGQDSGDDTAWYANLAESSGDSIVAVPPLRALAECEAKRRIVESARDAEEAGEHALQTAEEYARAQALEDVCELLALPYASHPDYDQAWAV
jgi:hypothetical protein